MLINAFANKESSNNHKLCIGQKVVNDEEVKTTTQNNLE